jgi:nucleotide-binding universal stress UspA family protein
MHVDASDATATHQRQPLPRLECQTVLVPLDGSPLAERALGPAVWLADRLDADLHVITAAVPHAERRWYTEYLDSIAERLPAATSHRSEEHDVARAVQSTAADVGGAHRHRAHGPDDDPDGYIRRLIERPDLAAIDADGKVIWDPTSVQGGMLDHLRASPATLVAVATHSRTGIARMVVGSEAARIVQTSPVPVIVRPIPRQ